MENNEVYYLIKGSTLQAIANAIKAKTGKTEAIKVEDFATEIGSISPGVVLDGNAAVTDVLSGKTFYSNNATKKTGTIANYTGEEQ